MGAAALGIAASIACRTGCGLLGGAIGSEIASLLGGIACDTLSMNLLAIDPLDRKSDR